MPNAVGCIKLHRRGEGHRLDHAVCGRRGAWPSCCGNRADVGVQQQQPDRHHKGDSGTRGRHWRRTTSRRSHHRHTTPRSTPPGAEIDTETARQGIARLGHRPEGCPTPRGGNWPRTACSQSASQSIRGMRPNGGSASLLATEQQPRLVATATCGRLESKCRDAAGVPEQCGIALLGECLPDAKGRRQSSVVRGLRPSASRYG